MGSCLKSSGNKPTKQSREEHHGYLVSLHSLPHGNKAAEQDQRELHIFIQRVQTFCLAGIKPPNQTCRHLVFDFLSFRDGDVLCLMQYLEENKQLIMVIMENQNLGKAAECALYQTQLQNNLTYLAKIADNQPQPPKAPSQLNIAHPSIILQTLSQPSMQEEHNMQESQAAMSQQQQQGFISPMSPFPLNDQQQQQLSYVQQQQLIQAQMGMRPAGTSPTGIYQSRPGANFIVIQGSRQDGSEGVTSDGIGR
ncbi:hypothetical protein LWI29_032159 [Acer saccharum]|uniref:SS18 N-terminal domain-containing protein n=1 Tax=Acer saccharum TaxID=4024 RepID=A0AA39SJZ7_ACESA|nr:hypothetical protein LWI29_032159 [Acer saccharum]